MRVNGEKGRGNRIGVEGTFGRGAEFDTSTKRAVGAEFPLPEPEREPAPPRGFRASGPEPPPEYPADPERPRRIHPHVPEPSREPDLPRPASRRVSEPGGEQERGTPERPHRLQAGHAPDRADRMEAELSVLAVRASAGDRASLGRFLELIRPHVVRYCWSRLGSGGGVSTPEDVAQDVLLAVCGALPRYRPGETATMAFVYGIARNKVVDAFRSAGRDHSEPTDQVPDAADGGAGPEVEAILTTEVAELRGLLNKLSESHREVLVMRVAMGYSAEETARIVGSTAGAVRVTQHRALVKLRALAARPPG